MTVEPHSPGTTRPGLRRSLLPFVAPGIGLALVYSLLSTWSMSMGFGGVDDDGHWIDVHGNPVATAPPTVEVVARPALWVLLVLAGILVATALWTRRADGRHARVRGVLGIAVATLFIAATVVVFSFVQSGLIQDAFDHGVPTPPILGNVVVTTGHLTRD